MSKANDSTSGSSFSTVLSQSSAFDTLAGSSNSSNLLGFADFQRHPDRLTAADDGVRCVVIPKDVTICYGPYMVQGILDFRMERLQGLQHAFYKLGVHTILKKAHHINLLKIWYMDTVIFSCKMTDLHHGGDGSLDGKCKQAAKIFQSVFHKAGHEMHLRQILHRTKEEDVCNYCVCAHGRKNPLHDDKKSISSAQSQSLHLDSSGSSTVVLVAPP